MEEPQAEQRPFEVLRTLPVHATPAQEDSAIQSIYNKHSAERVHVSDSITWPDFTKEPQRNAINDTLPTYYRETFLSRDTVFNSEYHIGRLGVAGDPIPYTIRTDNVLSSVIIVSTLIMLFCVRRASRFFSFQYRNFFRIVRNDSMLVKEAASDTRNLIYISLYGAMILSLVFFSFTKEYVAETYITYSEYTLMAIYMAEIAGYIFGEILLQRGVNSVFFPRQLCEQYVATKLLLSSTLGIILTPLLLLIAYFGLETQDAILYSLVAIILTKICAFYKAFLIFFRKKSLCLPYFLYLCTLEIVTTLIAWGIMMVTANFLKVNY